MAFASTRISKTARAARGRRAREAVARLAAEVPPSGGAAVMGTGIVSIGLSLVGHETLSRVLFGVAAALWLGLSAILAHRALRRPQRWLREARGPGALTAVAGTAVLGARSVRLGEAWTGWLLLAAAVCLWLALLAPVLRHWITPTAGVSFVLAVATESLAVLAALLAGERRLGWLAAAALVPLAGGLIAYVLVLVHLDLHELVTGRGDHWIAGGALAIATLACARVAGALTSSSALAGARPALDDASLGLWAAAALWLPALLAAELASPRLSYHTHRWSTVFPLGMYAVCSLAAGTVTGIGGLRSFGSVWIWIALAVWAIVAAGTLRRGARLLRPPRLS